MKLVKQPPKSNCCGQACVATICDITLEEACMLCRTHGKTRTKDLKAALTAMGIEHGDRRVRGLPKEGSAILFWKSADNKRGHWVIWHKRKYYDPAAGVFRNPPRHLQESRVTSHLTFTPVD